MKIVIHGDTPSKKNNRTILTKGGKLINIPGKVYRRWHKTAMEELKVVDECILRSCEKVRIELYPKTLRKFDITNKAESVMDALVDAGILPDDNWEVVPKVEIVYMGKDKENPRAECELIEAKQ